MFTILSLSLSLTTLTLDNVSSHFSLRMLTLAVNDYRTKVATSVFAQESEEMAEKMYDAFVSGAPRHGRRSGYGLGLAICKAAVDDHGGSISFENRSTGGARFQVKFPREPMPAPQDGPVATSSST